MQILAAAVSIVISDAVLKIFNLMIVVAIMAMIYNPEQIACLLAAVRF